MASIIVDLGFEQNKINNRLLAVIKAVKKYPNRYFYVFYPEDITLRRSNFAFDNLHLEAVHNSAESAIKAVVSQRALGQKHIVVSAGDTGKLIISATRNLGRKEGCKPVLASIWPKSQGEILVLDVGGNNDTLPTPAQLMNQIEMAGQFCQLHMGKQNPNFAILNIGEEKTKGTRWHIEAYALCQNTLGKRFFGFIEPHIICGPHDADIVLTPGFIGNIMLKTAEGVLGILVNIREELKNNRQWHLLPLAYLFLILYRLLFRRYDWHKRGWAILLGFDTVIIKAHSRIGRSFFYAIEKACKI